MMSNQFVFTAETKAPIDCFNKMLEEHEQQFTPRWLGVTGDDHVPR